MNNLRAKAREIKAEGEAERGNFTPSGVPKRLYQWWLANTNSKKGKAIRWGDRKENFCHFWRVVLIWAPFMGLRKAAEKALPFIIGVALLAIVAGFVALLVFEPSLLWQIPVVAVAAVVIILIMFGIPVGIEWATGPEPFENVDMSTGRAYKWMRFFVPTVVVFFLIAKFFLKVGPVVGRFFEGKGHLVAGALAVLGVIGFELALALTSGWVFALQMTGLMVAIAIAGLFVVFLCALLSDYISGLRAKARRRDDALLDAFIEKHGRMPTKAEQRKPPGRLARFFTGMADFIVLIAQVVRVKKWKICPVVEVEVDR